MRSGVVRVRAAACAAPLDPREEGNRPSAKTRSFLHGLMLETPSPHNLTLPVACANCVTFTSDMGTELGLADYEVPSWNDLMPRWPQPGASANLD
eukprot:14792879-Alexandrium_andersonii.AAC.1